MQLDGHLFGPDVLPSYANAATWMYSLVIGQSDHKSPDVLVSLLKECMKRWKNPCAASFSKPRAPSFAKTTMRTTDNWLKEELQRVKERQKATEECLLRCIPFSFAF